MIDGNMGIVGFSYDVSDIRSLKEPLTKRNIGRKTTQQFELAHGYNWSDEYCRGYGRSNIHLSKVGPFYSIVGGYTDYTSENSKSPNRKDKVWGIESNDKFCLFEGYCWNHFLNSKGYCRSYFYLTESFNPCNVLGSRIQSTSENSRSPWIETSFFGRKNEEETIWGACYGWSEKYDNGYNHFSLYYQTQNSILNYQYLIEETPPPYTLN